MYVFAAGCEGNPGYDERLDALEDLFMDSLIALSEDFQREVGYERDRPGEGDLRTAKQLRDAIAGLVTDVSQGRPQRPDQQAVVNRFAARPDVAPQLGAEPPAPTIDQILAGLAREAVHMLRDHADRIRECAGDNCALVYLDTSRSANRRWCSMSRCGNRHKVREQRARQAARSARERPSARTDPTGEPA